MSEVLSKMGERLVHRFVDIDLDVDGAVLAQALRDGVSNGAAFRSYLERGLALQRRGASLTALPSGTRLMQRSVYLTEDMDGHVSSLAFSCRMSRNDVVRQLVRLGMLASVGKSG